MSSRFKSHHCGIETEDVESAVLSEIVFKSHHCGIETPASQLLEHRLQGFKSHHCGIETRDLLKQLGCSPSSNRTTVGLKRASAGSSATPNPGSNRTTVGLKRAQRQTTLLSSPWFKSHHCGIETRVVRTRGSRAGGSNRTTVGLKPGIGYAASLLRRVQIAPLWD